MKTVGGGIGAEADMSQSWPGETAQGASPADRQLVFAEDDGTTYSPRVIRTK